MFKPNKKLQKAMSEYGSCAYIYRDGVVVIEKRKVKVDKDVFTDVEITHVFHGKTGLYCRDFTREWGDRDITVDRLVIHDSRLIANGFDRVWITFDQSEKLKDLGYIHQSVHFENGFHRWENDCIINLTYDGITVQPNKYASYTNYNVASSVKDHIKYLDTVVEYGTPVEEEKTLYLTVDN